MRKGKRQKDYHIDVCIGSCFIIEVHINLNKKEEETNMISSFFWSEKRINYEV